PHQVMLGELPQPIEVKPELGEQQKHQNSEPTSPQPVSQIHVWHVIHKCHYQADPAAPGVIERTVEHEVREVDYYRKGKERHPIAAWGNEVQELRIFRGAEFGVVN